MARKRKISEKTLTKDDMLFEDLIFTFKYCNIIVECDPEIYTISETRAIENIIRGLSKEIVIDKSYVRYKGTKFEKTFLTEHGWKELCIVVIATHYGKKLSKDENAILLEAYKMMIWHYILYCLEDLGYNLDGIDFSLADDSRFLVETQIDHIKAWNHYSGKWQTWKKCTNNKKEDTNVR